MFYSETILSRRGPLGKVWLAAHMERKLSKTQTLQTDIEQSVDAIMGQEIEVMALRLSGQLLLGVVRIYSRKAKYLLDDCNEALLKIKMAFRPGIVDMTEDQLAVSKNAITLQMGGLDLDLLLPDVNWDLDFEHRPLLSQGHHQAHVDDITLRTADDLNQLDFSESFDIGPSDGIGSQDFYDVDLGINWGNQPAVRSNLLDKEDEDMSVDESVGVGRDAHNEFVDSHFFERGPADMDIDLQSLKPSSRAPSVHPFGGEMDLDLQGLDAVDLAVLGIGFDAMPNPEPERGATLGQTRSPSHASSPLTEPPLTPPVEETVAEATATSAEASKPRKKAKEKKQIIDSVTELTNVPGTRLNRGRNGVSNVVSNVDVKDILNDQQFLPRSSMVMKLLEIREDPLPHFLPVKNTLNGNYLCAAPPGLTPELAALFIRPISQYPTKRRDHLPEKPASKRSRWAAENDSVGQGRRTASISSERVIGSDVLSQGGAHDNGLEFPDQPPLDDFELDQSAFNIPDLRQAEGRNKFKSPAPSELSRLSTPAPDNIFDEEGTYANTSCPIAMFGFGPSTQPSDQEESQPTDSKGYSKNTVKALGLIRKELQTSDEISKDKVISLKAMTNRASRRAAASFFFELLVLGTRDCVNLSQEAPFTNISIRAKDTLWERYQHESLVRSTSRATTPTPSRSISLTPS